MFIEKSSKLIKKLIFKTKDDNLLNIYLKFMFSMLRFKFVEFVASVESSKPVGRSDETGTVN